MKHLCCLPWLLTLGACVGTATSGTLSLRELDSGIHSGLDGSGLQVARDAREWAELWSRHTSTRLPRPPPPQVDFAREMALFVCNGTHPSAGWGLVVESARIENGELLLLARETAPDPHRLTAQVLTTPYAFVALEQSQLPLRLVIER